MVKYVFDLDDTLVATTALNNDAYNYALEKHGYSRITTRHRITRNELDYIPKEKLNEIIADKQLYFSRKWLPCRVILNDILLNKIKKLGQKICYLWTSAEPTRTAAILKLCRLQNMFDKVIFDDKHDLNSSVRTLKCVTHATQTVIYENDAKLSKCRHIKIIGCKQSECFNVFVYQII